MVDGFAGSDSGGGLDSRAVALRFRDAGGGRVDKAAAAAAGTSTEAPEDSEELAACLADARVILEDMSICFLMMPSAHSVTSVQQGGRLQEVAVGRNCRRWMWRIDEVDAGAGAGKVAIDLEWRRRWKEESSKQKVNRGMCTEKLVEKSPRTGISSLLLPFRCRYRKLTPIYAAKMPYGYAISGRFCILFRLS